MKEVSIIFANLQSHEHTSFTLRPGVNFILAEDNNVGKSTIFKVLSTVAKAPQVNGVKIDRLIRNGTDKAYAVFSYEGERVVVWFQRGATPGAAKLFFEHVCSDGTTTRHIACPQSLLDALGIVVSAEGGAINFNDADSVQLISRNTAEADAIINYVMQDQRVETVKQNMYKFSRDLASDDREMTARLETAEQMLNDLSYIPAVDEFNETMGELDALCRVCDACLKPMSGEDLVCSQEDLDLMQKTLLLIESIEPLVLSGGGGESTVPPADFEALARVVSALDAIDYDALGRVSVLPEDLNRLAQEYNLVRRMGSVMASCINLEDLARSERRVSDELTRLKDELRATTKEVVCPVKGKVYYSDEECIPYSD